MKNAQQKKIKEFQMKWRGWGERQMNSKSEKIMYRHIHTRTNTYFRTKHFLKCFFPAESQSIPHPCACSDKTNRLIYVHNIIHHFHLYFFPVFFFSFAFLFLDFIHFILYFLFLCWFMLAHNDSRASQSRSEKRINLCTLYIRVIFFLSHIQITKI